MPFLFVFGLDSLVILERNGRFVRWNTLFLMLFASLGIISTTLWFIKSLHELRELVKGLVFTLGLIIVRVHR